MSDKTASGAPEAAVTFRDTRILSILAGIYLLIGLGSGSLASWDEAYYAILSADIVRTGDWIHLRALGVDCYDKPPLYFWITALFYHLGGVSEFATRLGSALSGCGLVIGTYLLGRRLLGREAAFAGALLLLTSKDFIHYARFGTLDVMNLCWMVAAGASGVAALEAASARMRTVRWIGFWIFSALAVMTKGPLIFVLWGVLGLWAAGTGRWLFWKNAAFGSGAVLFLLLVIPWHVAAWLHNREKFVQDFLIKHYLSRTGQAVEGHAGGWDYYFRKVLINKHKPWFALEVAALAGALVGYARGRLKGVTGPALLILWAVVFVGLFSFGVKTKLPWYVMPAYPALALLAGWGIARVARGRTLAALLTIAALVPVTYLNSSSAFGHDHAPTIKSLSAVVQQSVPDDRIVYLYNFHEQPAANFYWKRKVAYLDSVADVERAYAAGSVFAVAVRGENEAGIGPVLTRLGFHKTATTPESKDPLSLWLLTRPSV